MMTVTVKQLLETKGTDVWSVTPKASVFEALQIMADKDIGALLVMEEENLVGIFSERDYARNAVRKETPPKDTLVGELMTRDVCYIRPGKTIEDCMALMTAKRIRHLPVIENDQVIGVVSIGDVVKKVISEQKFTIEELENYIKAL